MKVYMHALIQMCSAGSVDPQYELPAVEDCHSDDMWPGCWVLTMTLDYGAVCFPAKGRKIVSRKTSFPFFVVCFAAKQLAKYNSHFPLAVATVKFVVI